MFLLVSSGHKRPHQPLSSYPHGFESLTEGHTDQILVRVTDEVMLRRIALMRCTGHLHRDRNRPGFGGFAAREGDYLELFFVVLTMDGETPRKCVYHITVKRLQ